MVSTIVSQTVNSACRCARLSAGLDSRGTRLKDSSSASGLAAMSPKEKAPSKAWGPLINILIDEGNMLGFEPWVKNWGFRGKELGKVESQDSLLKYTSKAVTDLRHLESKSNERFKG